MSAKIDMFAKYKKNIKTSAFLTVALAAFGAALPQAASAFQDGDSGCRILLCLANPNGPMSVAECKPDIKAFFRAIARGKSYPSCQGGAVVDKKLNSEDYFSKKIGEEVIHFKKFDLAASGAYFNLTHDNYKLCPSGTTDSRKIPGLVGANVAIPNSMGRIKASPAQGNGSFIRFNLKDMNVNNPTMIGSSFGVTGSPLACVGKRLGTYKACLNGGPFACDSDEYTTIQMFDRIVYRKYNPNSFVANVFIDNKLWQRVRLFGSDVDSDTGADVEKPE